MRLEVDKRGLAYTKKDNAFISVDDPVDIPARCLREIRYYHKVESGITHPELPVAVSASLQNCHRLLNSPFPSSKKEGNEEFLP